MERLLIVIPALDAESSGFKFDALRYLTTLDPASERGVTG